MQPQPSLVSAGGGPACWQRVSRAGWTSGREQGAQNLCHPDRVPHSDTFFFRNSVGCFFVCSIIRTV